MANCSFKNSIKLKWPYVVNVIIADVTDVKVLHFKWMTLENDSLAFARFAFSYYYVPGPVFIDVHRLIKVQWEICDDKAALCCACVDRAGHRAF